MIRFNPSHRLSPLIPWLVLGLAVALAGTATLTAGCGGQDISRHDVLASLADDVITPRFAAAGTASRTLHESIAVLATSPSPETLRGARDAWRDARAAWSRTEAMWFGPVTDRRSRSLVGWWPIDRERIESRLGQASVVTAEETRERFASTQRGFSALEHLIFQPGDDLLRQLQDEVLSSYLVALTGVIADEIAAVSAEWSGSYGDRFAGGDGRVVAEAFALADVVRFSVFLTETVGDIRLGGALGALGGEPDPQAIPGGSAEQALEDLRQDLLGMQDLYLGATEGRGLTDLVSAHSGDTDQRMREAFGSAFTALDRLTALDLPLKAAVVEHPNMVGAVRDAIKHLQRVLATEVVSLLGVSVGFSDNDGDS